jgi:hypothetical protein
MRSRYLVLPLLSVVGLIGILTVFSHAHAQQPSAAQQDARFQMVLRQVIEQAPNHFEALKGRSRDSVWLSTLAGSPPDLAPYRMSNSFVGGQGARGRSRLYSHYHVIVLRAPGADRDEAARERLWEFVQRNVAAVVPGWRRIGIYSANDTWGSPHCDGGLVHVLVRREESSDELMVVVAINGNPTAACVVRLGGVQPRAAVGAASARGDGSLHLTGRLLARFADIGPHVRVLAGEAVDGFDRLKGEPLEPSGGRRAWRSPAQPLDLSPFSFRTAFVRESSDHREHYSIYSLQSSDEIAFWVAFLTVRNGIQASIPSNWSRSSVDAEGDTWSRNCPGGARIRVHVHPEPELREIGISVRGTGRPTCALQGW